MNGNAVNLIAVPFLIGSVPLALSVIIGNRFLKTYRDSNKFVFWGGITASAFAGWTVSNMIMARYTESLDFEDEVLTMYRFYIEDPYGWELDEPDLTVKEYKQRFIEKGNPTIKQNAESFSAGDLGEPEWVSRQRDGAESKCFDCGLVREGGQFCPCSNRAESFSADECTYCGNVMDISPCCETSYCPCQEFDCDCEKHYDPTGHDYPEHDDETGERYGNWEWSGDYWYQPKNAESSR
jgi:hypothetical protein